MHNIHHSNKMNIQECNRVETIDYQGDLFRGLGFRASGGGLVWLGGFGWLLSYLCRVEVPCLARARRTFKNARFGIPEVWAKT